MRTKLLLTNILLALALPLAPTGARADSVTGAGNITIGSAPTNATGLLYGDGAHVQSLPGTYAAGSGYIGNIFTLGNNYDLALQSDGSKSTAPLTVSITSTAYNYNNQAEFYAVAGNGINYLSTYINSAGVYTSLAMIASGHTNYGPGQGRQIVLPTVYIPSMFAGWPDIIGPTYLSRDGFASPGAFAFLGLNAAGVATIALDAQYSQFVLGNMTVGSGQVFVGDTFLSRAAAANLRFGGADAASPVAQTISFQNVLAGTSNTAGVNTTFQASAGTGNAAGGKFLFQTALPGSSGTTQNGFSTALTIDGAAGLTVGNGGSSTSQLFFTPKSGAGVGLGMANGGSMLLAFNSTGGQIGGVWGSGFVVPNNECYAFANSSSTVTGGGAISLCMVSTSVLNLTAGYAGTTAASLAVTSIITPPLTYSTLPGSPTAGQRTYITDANTTTPYATVSSGGGSSKISVLYNGSNWVVD